MKKKTTTSLATLLERFFRQRLVAQRQSSPATIAGYRDSLRLLLCFVATQTGKKPNQLTIENLDRDSVLAFLDSLEHDRGNCVRTRNTRLAAIRSFHRYAAECDPAPW